MGQRNLSRRCHPQVCLRLCLALIVVLRPRRPIQIFESFVVFSSNSSTSQAISVEEVLEDVLLRPGYKWVDGIVREYFSKYMWLLRLIGFQKGIVWMITYLWTEYSQWIMCVVVRRGILEIFFYMYSFKARVLENITQSTLVEVEDILDRDLE